MTNSIFITLILLSFYSCAAVTNTKQTRIEIHSFPKSASICLDNDSCFESPVILEVPRSYNDFNIVVRNDSTEKAVRIKSRVAPEFLWGNVLLLYYAPLGYMIDAASREKMYSYNNSILVDLTKKTGNYRKWEPSNLGQFYYRSSFPWFDFVGFDNGRGFKNYTIFMGITEGVDYYHSKHSYLSLSGGLTGFNDIAFPVMDKDYPDTIQMIKSFSGKLTNNHDLNVFPSNKMDLTLGYGLSFTHFSFSQTTYDYILLKEIEVHKNAISTIGLCADVNVIFFKYYYIGYNSLISVYNLNRHKWEYSILQYFDFGVRLPLGNYSPEKMRIVKYKPKLLERIARTQTL